MFLEGPLSRDHVHLLVSSELRLSVSLMVKYIKGKPSRVLQQEFGELRRHEGFTVADEKL